MAGFCGQSGLRELNLGEEGLAWLRDRYDGGIHHADRLLGRFMARAGAAGLLEDTIVAVIADHGESLGENDWIGHNRLFTEQLQVPWLLAGAGIPQGRVIDGPSHLVDLVPTLLDYAGLPAPDRIAGRSLRTVVDGAAELPEDRLRVTETKTARALLRGPWMMITSLSGDRILRVTRRDGRSMSGEDDLPGTTPIGDLQGDWEDLAQRLQVDATNLEEAEIPDAGEVRQELRTLGYVD